MIMVALIGFFGFPFSQQIPALARNVLQQVADTEELVAARTGGLYLAQGIGALIAALFVSAFSTLRRKGLLMTIGQFVFSVFLVLIAFAHTLPVAMVLIGIIGWATIAQFMMMNTLIQIDVPDELRGRVFSVYLWAQQGVAPFGSLFIGWLAQTAGVPARLWWVEWSACWWWCSRMPNGRYFAKKSPRMTLIVCLTGFEGHVMMPTYG